jgi:D-alanine-D-alanine ligase-like ATP-grasp enzyme
MIKKYTSSKHTNLFLNSAENLSLNFEILDETKNFIKIYSENKELFLIGCKTQFNNAIGRFFAKNKDQSINRLKRYDIPVPKYKRFKNKDKALIYALNLKHEFVVKPSNDSCSNGVTVNPKGNIQITKAIEEAFSIISEHGFVMIEDYIKGKDYRITVFDNSIIAVTYREPGHVIGDGIHDIYELIKIENKNRTISSTPLISLRNKDMNFLKNRGLTIKHIPAKGEYIRLQLGCDRDIGGDRHRINIDKISEDNINLFLKIPKLLKLRYAGIDLIIPNIYKSYKKQKCCINEVNSAPHQDVHYYDTTPGENYSCNKILQKYFEL